MPYPPLKQETILDSFESLYCSGKRSSEFPYPVVILLVLTSRRFFSRRRPVAKAVNFDEKQVFAAKNMLKPLYQMKKCSLKHWCRILLSAVFRLSRQSLITFGKSRIENPYL